MKTCPKCGRTEIDRGWILSAGIVAHKSDNMKYPMVGGNIRAFVCIRCGYAESFVSSDYLEKLRSHTS